MKKFQKYKKELTDEKDRIVALFGVDITKSLVNEYYGDEHSMDMREEFESFFDSEQNVQTQIDLSNENFEDLSALQNYEKDFLGERGSTN